jgi:hypothetical protein
VILTLTLFAALLMAVVAVGTTARPDRVYDPDSGGPRGLLGLRLWLADLGYRVETTAGERFRLPAGARLLLVFPGDQRFTDAEATEVRRWVEAGGTLALVGPDRRDRSLIEVFGVRPRTVVADPTLPLRPVQPWLPDAPGELGQLGWQPALDLAEAPAAAAIVAAENGAVTVAVQPARRGPRLALRSP